MTFLIILGLLVACAAAGFGGAICGLCAVALWGMSHPAETSTQSGKGL